VYRWWVFVHLIGVFAFLATHGVSMGVLFRLRGERDPHRISELLQLSSSSIQAFYVALGVLLLGGITAGFLGHWWSQAWIWVAIGFLVVVTMAMYAMARPYYQRVGFVARAMAGGSQAVSEEQLEEILRGPRPLVVAGIGIAGLVAILYLMMFKPSFGASSGTSAVPSAPSATVEVTAKNIKFDRTTLQALANQAITIVFHNADPGILHNVAIYSDSSAKQSLFVGSTFNGPKTETYHVPALSPGTFYFRCDVHHQMNGTFVVVAGSPSPGG